MTILNRLLIVAVAAFSTLAALADDKYQATKVTVSTSQASKDMTLLGTTADGNQVWTCLNTIGGDTDTKWTIDGTDVSKDEPYFYGANSYELSANFGNSEYRRLSNQTELYQFLKVNSQTSAQLFFSQSDASKLAYKDFCLAPKITLSVEDGYVYNPDEPQLVKTIKFSATGIEAEAVSSLVLKFSYDGGETWDSTATSFSSASTTLQAIHPLSAEKVRYKLTLYPKAQYRAVTEALYESDETEDIDISSRSRVVYNAKVVYMRPFRGKSSDGTSGGIGSADPVTKCSLLGVTNRGYQIWSRKISDQYFAYVEWLVDDDGILQAQKLCGTFEANTIHHLEDFVVDENTYVRYVCHGEAYTHFMKINGQRDVDYFSWKYEENSTSTFNPTEFKVDGKCTIAPTTGDFYYNESTGDLCQELKFSVMNANCAMFSNVPVEISWDGGKTWTTGTNITTFTGSDNEYSGKVNVKNIPLHATKVRYRMTLVPKNDYKIICDGWSYETRDYDVKLPTDDYNNVLVYKRVTSEDDLVAGDTYLIVNASGKKALGFQNDHTRKAEDVDISVLKVKIGQDRIATSKSEAIDATVSEFTLGGEAGSWTFRDKAVKGGAQYLYAASGSDASNYYLERTTQNLDARKASITISSTGDATITFGGYAAANIIGYNSDEGIFTCYPQENAPEGIQSVQLYRKVSTFTLSSVGYGTFYTDDAYTMPNYVTGYTVTLKNDNTIQLNEAYTTGDAVPARTGLLLKGPAGSYDVLAVSSTETAPADNLLYGSVVNTTTTSTGAAKYYKLSLGTDNKAGFYYGAKDGAAFTNKAYKAYLALPAAAASQVRGFAFDDLDGTTSVLDAVITPNNTVVPARIYDLNGRRISSLCGAQKGVYIVNGQKVMVK